MYMHADTIYHVADKSIHLICLCHGLSLIMGFQYIPMILHESYSKSSNQHMVFMIVLTSSFDLKN